MSSFSFFTGDIPVQDVLSDDTPVDALPFRVRSILWAGCIDAPDYLPAGSACAVRVPEDGIVATIRYVARTA